MQNECCEGLQLKSVSPGCLRFTKARSLNAVQTLQFSPHWPRIFTLDMLMRTFGINTTSRLYLKTAIGVQNSSVNGKH